MPTALTVKLFAQYQACRYASVAAISVWVYDYFLTVADELELLWSRNGILVKSLYLMVSAIPTAISFPDLMGCILREDICPSLVSPSLQEVSSQHGNLTDPTR
ncbi:hypothetical protein FRC18_005488 [Serendipita sp. 400]|nr:hypothetical protein FRC18_005488 [Serendipita sp. 400]